MNSVNGFFERDDSELIDKLFDYVMENDFDPVTATEPERALIYLVTAYGILGNGGLRYFFENDFEDSVSHQEVITFFSKIGNDNTAEILLKAINLFPDGVVPSDLGERSVLLDNLFNLDKNEEKIEELEKKLFLSMESDMKNLATYIRHNQSEFDSNPG